MANISAFQANDASSILATRTKEIMLKALHQECFLFDMILLCSIHKNTLSYHFLNL